MEMKTYKATAVVNINGGRVRLDSEQVRRRALCLSPAPEKDDDGKYKGGEFDVAQKFQMKAGEEFGFDGDIPKAELVDFGVDKKKAIKKKAGRKKPSAESRGDK